MKHIILLQILLQLAYAQILTINSFEADFKQELTDEKGKVISYKGHISAVKPNYALWKYETPLNKEIYVSKTKVIILEPEIEQVIIRNTYLDFDIFDLIKNAIMLKENTYKAHFRETDFQIVFKNSLISSISYKDELDNSIKILFSKQLQNKKIPLNRFIPSIPDEYDVIRD